MAWGKTVAITVGMIVKANGVTRGGKKVVWRGGPPRVTQSRGGDTLMKV